MEVFLASFATDDYNAMASALSEMGATGNDINVNEFAKDLEKIFSSIQVIFPKIVGYLMSWRPGYPVNMVTQFRLLSAKNDARVKPGLCLVHTKIGSLVEIGTMWRKSWKFVCVGKYWCDGKVGSLKKNFGTKHGAGLAVVKCWMQAKVAYGQEFLWLLASRIWISFFS